MGPLIRTVSSIDTSIELQPTSPGTYTSMTKTTSYNIIKQILLVVKWLFYIPNVEWDAIKVEGILRRHF